MRPRKEVAERKQGNKKKKEVNKEGNGGMDKLRCKERKRKEIKVEKLKWGEGKIGKQWKKEEKGRKKGCRCFSWQESGPEAPEWTEMNSNALHSGQWDIAVRACLWPTDLRLQLCATCCSQRSKAGRRHVSVRLPIKRYTPILRGCLSHNSPDLNEFGKLNSRV